MASPQTHAAPAPPRSVPRRVARALLLTVLLPFILVALVLTMIVLIPITGWFIVNGFQSDRRFWRKASREGRVASWPDIRARLEHGEGTFIIDFGAEGWCDTQGYWLTTDPAELDPQAICPRWATLEGQTYRAIHALVTGRSDLERWTTQHLAPRAGEAKFVRIPRKAIQSQLDAQAKRDRVLLVWHDQAGSIESIASAGTQA
ncbi:MAG: hypothetical protein NTW19_10960 [Planctomycetota bacterium]|nr:hypothetical protein [Planctomycetota bacterium]